MTPVPSLLWISAGSLTAEFEGLKLSIQNKNTRDETKHRGMLEAIQSIGKAVEECNKQLQRITTHMFPFEE